MEVLGLGGTLGLLVEWEVEDEVRDIKLIGVINERVDVPLPEDS